MDKSSWFVDYLGNINQRIDWLVTACSSSYTHPVAREDARKHLNETIASILKETYEIGFVAGKKEASLDYGQRNKVTKFKIAQKLRVELKKQILDVVLKEYGIKDERSKKRIIKKVIGNETDLEENDREQES